MHASFKKNSKRVFSRFKTDVESQKVVSVFSTLQYLKKKNWCGYINILVPLPLGWWPPKPHAPNTSIPPRATQPHPPRKHAYLKPGKERINHSPRKDVQFKTEQFWMKWIRDKMPHPVLLLVLFFSSPAEQSQATRYLSELSDAPGKHIQKHAHKHNINRMKTTSSEFSYIYQQFNYLVTKYFPPQYSSVNGLILINNIWWQRETKHRLTDIFHVFCGEKICRRPVQTEMSFFSISNYFKLNE